MTLRYTEIRLETVGDAYWAALTKLDQRCRIAIKSAPEVGIDLDEMLEDVIRWLKKRGAEHPDDSSRDT